MLLAMNNATSASVFAARGVDAEILGVVDLTNKTEAQIGPTSLGMAIQFVANASVLGYDVRKAMVFYGDPGRQVSGQETANDFGRNMVALS